MHLWPGAYTYQACFYKKACHCCCKARCLTLKIGGVGVCFMLLYGVAGIFSSQLFEVVAIFLWSTECVDSTCVTEALNGEVCRG